MSTCERMPWCPTVRTSEKLLGRREIRRSVMGKKKKKRQKYTRPKQGGVTLIAGNAPPHGALKNSSVHVFVDDQNLFLGITKNEYGPSFRIDFGLLLLTAARATDGQTRGIASAYIAGVIPDDDLFWQIAENKGFMVRRGYLDKNGRSKQDDAYLITDMTKTVCKQPGPSTVVLVAGDADYAPPLKAALDEGWRTEVAFIGQGVSTSLGPCAHEIRSFSPTSIEYIRD